MVGSCSLLPHDVRSMNTLLQFLALTWLTGNPLVALAILVVGGWLVDRLAVGLLPDPIRWVRRYLRANQLRAQLAARPHDRRAALELAQWLNDRGRHAEALPLAKKNLEAGDHDKETLFTAAVAYTGAGQVKEGDLLFTEVLAQDPRFRQGEVHLARGRLALRRGDAPVAKEALESFCAERVGTVEGRVLLARALDGLGDAATARARRDEAWNEYRLAPRFRRKAERLWAWRARPTRPLLYAGLFGLGLFLLTRGLR